MKTKVKLEDIIDAINLRLDDSRSFLNIKTGEVITLTFEDMGMAEDDTDIEQLPECQRDIVEAAIDVEENFENYIELPDKEEIKEYGMMEDFIDNLKDKKLSQKLYSAIQGRGALENLKIQYTPMIYIMSGINSKKMHIRLLQ